jgi:hypothetical protein
MAFKKEVIGVFGIVQFVAVLSTTLFTGAALYTTLFEHPARLGCGTELSAREWALSCRRGMGMQTSLAAVGGLAGLPAWLMCGGILWAIGAFLIFAAIPFMLLPIMARSKQLIDQAQGTRAAKTGGRKFHLVRSVLGFAASCIYLALVVKT